MAKDGYIGFRVAEETKQRWQQVADENPEYRSLTHMICVAVRQELNDGAGGEVADVEVDLSRLHARFDAIEGTLANVEDRVDDTYSIIYRDEGDTGKIRAHVQEIIPTADRDDILSRDPQTYDDAEKAARQTGSVSHLVDHLQRVSRGDFVPSDIRHAIESLAEDVAVIETTYANPADEEDKRVYRVMD
jgi:hypothetical protein